MANVKSVFISGTMTFDASNFNDATHSGSNQTVLKFLGRISLPDFGLRIKFEDEEFYRENKFRGRTCFKRYKIEGEEAISYAYLRTIMAELMLVGEIEVVLIHDIENHEILCDHVNHI